MPLLRSTESAYFAFTDISIAAKSARSFLRTSIRSAVRANRLELALKATGVESLIFISITVL